MTPARIRLPGRALWPLSLLALSCHTAWAQAPAPVAATPPTGSVAMLSPTTTDYQGPTDTGHSLRLTVGRTALLRQDDDIVRLAVGSPGVADVMLINPREVYLLGKAAGSTNLVVWTRSGRTSVIEVVVGIDVTTLRNRLAELVPGEDGVRVETLADSVVLSGRVSDAVKVHRLITLAEVFASRKVVNLLRVDGPQQVMLEVKVAEVARSFLDKLGIEVYAARSPGNSTFSLLTRFLSGGAGQLEAVSGSGRTAISLDAEVRKGLIKVLAEPTIMAVSGQEGAFLAGGKVFIPVPRPGVLGGGGVTLQEKEFGVGLRFTPTVLEDGVINLQVTPEVSELSQLGVTVTSPTGQANVLPTITTRRAATTVQLRDGETFAIGGLVKNNVTEAVKALPVLGELPVLGALFRSTEFQNDRSELMFIVTPRLVRSAASTAGAVGLPTDRFIEPTRTERMLGGKLEGDPQAAERNGESLRNAQATQRTAPEGEAANLPGPGGEPARAAVQRYHKSFEQPASPARVLEIGIGTSEGAR